MYTIPIIVDDISGFTSQDARFFGRKIDIPKSDEFSACAESGLILAVKQGDRSGFLGFSNIYPLVN
jgi:hypothetical protein